ncbi:MAG: PDZ domain-containing protein [Anaerolineales bacterium]|nr:PDZ domain-containing protein [Anaerolineales bacterium]
MNFFRNHKETLLQYGLYAFNIALAFVLGWLLHGWILPREMDLPILSSAQQLLVDNGFYPVPDDPKLEYGMIHGMMSAYGDPYSRFVEPANQELETDSLTGSYGGIGCEIRIDENGNTLLYPFTGSPSEEEGVHPGDQLLKVDGVEITNEMSISEIAALVRGPENKTVKLLIFRAETKEEIEFLIKRGNIPLPSVTWYVALENERVGVVQINLVAETTPDEIKKAISLLEAEGVESFIMDLRGNGGGYLNEGVAVAELFLEEGDIIVEEFNDGSQKMFTVENPGPYPNIPLVVLVDGNTASAAEIIAGSLQAHHRVILVGTTTYGKNTVQAIYTLEDNSSLHLTRAEWSIPGLEFPTEYGGLIPDIIVSQEVTGIDSARQKAVDYLIGIE